MAENNEKFSQYLEQLSEEYSTVNEIVVKLQSSLNTLLDKTLSVPTGRVALAELVNSYTQLKKTQLDIIKAKIDVTQKQVKLNEETSDNSLPTDFLWKMQKYLISNKSNQMEDSDET